MQELKRVHISLNECKNEPKSAQRILNKPKADRMTLYELKRD